MEFLILSPRRKICKTSVLRERDFFICRKNFGACRIYRQTNLERSDTLIQIKNLGLELAQKEIFTGFNLDVQTGEKIGIVGGEGAGKSSLLDIIAGRLIQTSGEIEISGEVVTVTGNISADFSELRMAEMSAIDKRKRTLRGLDDAKIILLLDEPTKNLDAAGIDWLINFLASRQNLTTVIVSSDRYFLHSAASPPRQSISPARHFLPVPPPSKSTTC